MPPRSYVIIAAVLTALLAVSLVPTMGFAIILWYWAFEVAACVLVIAGAFMIASGLRAPLWIGCALASPAIVWALHSLHDMRTVLYMSNQSRVVVAMLFYLAAYVAVMAAAAASLRLIDMISGPRAAIRVGYGILAVSALMVAIRLSIKIPGGGLYDLAQRATSILAASVEYGAFFAAVALISARYSIERWIVVTVGTISALMLCQTLWSLSSAGGLVNGGGGLMFWLQPVVLLVGATAIYRMGAILRAYGAQSGLDDPAASPFSGFAGSRE